MNENLALSKKFKKIIEEIEPKPFDISFAVIDLKTSRPEIAGYNIDNFMYPASNYKTYIAAEILRQASMGIITLDDVIEIRAPNDVDTDIRLFPRSTSRDHYPLLKAGDRVTIDHLLHLVFTRSDNTAANTLVDTAKREHINDNIILANEWKGSEVTRKFLDRKKEDQQYKIAEITKSNARHFVEMFYRIEKGILINAWVSEMLKDYLHRWNRGARSGLYIPEFIDYYRKGGWLEGKLYSKNILKSVKDIWKKKYSVIYWSNDTGVVTGKNSHYVIAVLTLTKSLWPWRKFPMKEFSRKVHQIMEEN